MGATPPSPPASPGKARLRFLACPTGFAAVGAALSRSIMPVFACIILAIVRLFLWGVLLVFYGIKARKYVALKRFGKNDIPWGVSMLFVHVACCDCAFLFAIS